MNKEQNNSDAPHSRFVRTHMARVVVSESVRLNICRHVVILVDITKTGRGNYGSILTRWRTEDTSPLCPQDEQRLYINVLL